MKLIGEYRSFVTGILFLLSLTLYWTGCERYEPDEGGMIDCDQCYADKPEWVQLHVRVTLNDLHPFVPLTVYKGNIEEGMVDWVDTAWNSDYWVDVLPDSYYSVKAVYMSDGDTIMAVDGDRVKLLKNTSECDETCYYQSGGYIDVRLRE
ncbi:MAG: hypothetical protein Kow00127_18210 [Bacteroidales bacterium]